MKRVILLCLVMLLLISATTMAQDDGLRRLRANFAWPTYIDPHVGSDFSSSISITNIYDTLIFPDPAGGSTTAEPWVAQSWDISDDGLTYTFHLRSDVLFHDGSEVQAGDIVYSYNRLKTLGEGFSYLLPEATVTAQDDFTVQFTLNNPDPLFTLRLSRFYFVNEELVRANYDMDSGLYGEHGDYGKEWLLTNDAGSGPYQVVEMSLAESLRMERFADYWNQEAFRENAADEVTFIGTTAASTIRSLLLNGDLEISDPWQSLDSLQEFNSFDGIHIDTTSMGSSLYFMLNNTLPPFDDVNCRRASALAIDYDTVASLEWQGTRRMIGILSQSTPGHNPDVFTPVRDLDAARAALSACQYADNIADYPIDVVWVTAVPDEEKFALLYQSNMAEIGMAVNVIASPWGNVVNDTASKELSPHIVLLYTGADLPEAGLLIEQRYHSKTAATFFQNEWLEDPELDAAIEDALATVDSEERFAKYAALQEQLAEDVVSFFLYDQLEKRAVADYVDWDSSAGARIQGYHYYLPQIGVNNP
ncbi:MAG: ABC transporter substrate-binding protein [Anaerolineaceae bacterium]|nr:ABC transporter substrate-binding protein [Anaerolineaceae bacterium]